MQIFAIPSSFFKHEISPPVYFVNFIRISSIDGVSPEKYAFILVDSNDEFSVIMERRVISPQINERRKKLEPNYDWIEFEWRLENTHDNNTIKHVPLQFCTGIIGYLMDIYSCCSRSCVLN